MFNPCNNQSAIGNLVKTPELRTWASGTTYCDCTIGVNRPGQDAGTDFLRVRIKGKAAEALVKFGTPGRLIAVAGTHRQETVEHAGKAFHVSHLETVAFKFLDKKPAVAEVEAEEDMAPWEEDEAPVAKAAPKAAVKPAAKPVAKAVAKPEVKQVAKTVTRGKVKPISFSDSDIPE